ncbi:MAG TPA: hypothetical protein DCE22_03880 [Verrucomicrobiales bacterium]|nr:hypothetical protein [Verrucomicrobiales bacterium]
MCLDNYLSFPNCELTPKSIMKHYLLGILISLTGTFLLPAQEDDPAADGVADVIDVTDEDAITNSIGKAIMVTGKVRHSDSSPRTSDIRIWFSDSGFRLLIKSDVFDSKEGWGIDEIIEKQIFVHGKVIRSGEFIQINLTSPDQIATSLDKVTKLKAPTNKPGKDGPKTFEPVSPGAILPVKPSKENLLPMATEAKVKVILAMYATEVPTMVVSEVKAEIIDAEEGGPMQASFESKPKITDKPMVSVMTYLPKKYFSQGWPRNKAVHFVVDEIQADSIPPNFAAAFLIECLLKGIKVPENLVLFGGMGAGGALNYTTDKKRSDASIGEAIKLTAEAAQKAGVDPDEGKLKSNFTTPSALGKKAPVVNQSFYLLTSNVDDGILDDLILDDHWDVINSTQIISCENIDVALNLTRELSEGSGTGKSINDLSAAQKVLRERSIRMLSNAQVWSRVVGAGRASKNNKTAYAYARLKTRKVAKTYSLDRCLSHINKQIITARGNSLDKFVDRELRKYVRDLSNTMKEIQPKIHPSAVPVLASGQLYLKEIANYSASKRDTAAKAKPAKKEGDKKAAKVVPDRVQKQFDMAKKAYEDARAEALKAP